MSYNQITNLNFHLWDCRYMLVDEWNFANVIFPHWHCYWGATSSNATIHCNNKIIHLNAEELILIPPATLIESKSPDPVMQLYCHFSLDISLTSVRPDCYVIELDANSMANIKKICAMANDQPFVPTPLSMLEIGGFISQMVSKLPQEAFTKHTVIVPKIKQTMDFLKENYTQNISNTFLAQKIYMSRNAFLRLFSKQVGCAPQQYVHQLRMEKACMQLRFTSLSIEEIAEETGYSDRYHFSRMFKKFQKISPAAYRKLMR